MRPAEWLILACLVLWAGVCTGEQVYAVGYRLGAGSSHLDGAGAPEGTASAFAGIPAGLYPDSPLSTGISVRTELNWVKYSFDSEDEEYGYTHYYDYLQVPALFKLSMSRGSFSPITFGQSSVFNDEYEEAGFRSTLFTLGMGYAFRRTAAMHFGIPRTSESAHQGGTL
ncbi:MAG: hypothetical protein AVO35_06265 [Candidatus Aegiribacteria sp. MLS_C]|nr:MAG: hypothetical protein AVO35_06265 [Candidatus Aegiribacteria sp. MLS_C]